VLEVRLAGGLALRTGGAELPPPASRRARAVLAYLALRPGAHARARLAAQFWPDVLDESARTSLRAALSELRRALGPAAGHLVATRETVALDGAGLAVDTRAFEAALDAGRAVASYGVADRHLGGLAALLGRRDDAVRHLRAAIARNDELGCTVWRLHAQWWLQRVAPEDPLVASAAETARRLGLTAP
jgi:DNA-binding SARP family transcriptional activator